MSEKLQGTVRWFNEKKGFGFIESGGENYFFHFSALEIEGIKTASQDTLVRFKPSKGMKGWQAEDIEKI